MARYLVSKPYHGESTSIWYVLREDVPGEEPEVIASRRRRSEAVRLAEKLERRDRGMKRNPRYRSKVRQDGLIIPDYRYEQVDGIANKDDYDDGFWRKYYAVRLSPLTGVVLVNANNETAALDEAVDYAENMGWRGLFLSEQDLEDHREGEDYLDVVFAGNSGQPLLSYEIRICDLGTTRPEVYDHEVRVPRDCE